MNNKNNMIYLINNRLRNNITSLDNIIELITNGKYDRSYSVYIYAGLISHIITNYNNLIENQMQINKYNSLIEKYKEIYKLNQSLLTQYIKEGLEKKVKRYTTTATLYNSASFSNTNFKDSSIDFDVHFLGSRDDIEFSIIGLNLLDHYNNISNIDTLLKQVISTDILIKKYLPNLFIYFFTNKIYKKSGFYDPKSFWWRKMEWKYYTEISSNEI